MTSERMNMSYKDLFDIEGHNILITGATGHLGSILCQELLRFGANVFAIGRNVEKLNLLKTKSLESDGIITTFRCDISKTTELEEIFKAIGRNESSLHGCINLASEVKGEKSYLEINREDSNYALNGLTSTMIISSLTARMMIEKSSRGSIVNFSSMYGSLSPKPYIYKGLENFGSHPAYGASKAGIIQFTKRSAIELAENGIRVNCISPGAFPSAEASNLEFNNRLSREIPLGRTGQPQELVGATLFLLSEASSFITGTELLIDGGWSAW
jgi:gluconate 5-dehydrogenase